ncbi:hypothetical protein J437_LFUL003200 [Ladona fulva]|uniref:Retrovirus-related Pol polyprotein from transposon TNT 1-94 n=1 Tax=Ladona fulva TaxID=123851 RepID=A0A8K0JXJ7_LADFU|nr:hypothetical protein J437_LFUL003200 [Ladona fulva]
MRDSRDRCINPTGYGPRRYVVIELRSERYDEADTTSQHVRERRDQKALAKICLMVKPAVYSHVRSANTALEAWQNLAMAFEDKGLNRRLLLLRSLCSIKLETFVTMEDYVNEVMSLSQKLAAVDKPVDDEFLGAIMLQGCRMITSPW